MAKTRNKAEPEAASPAGGFFPTPDEQAVHGLIGKIDLLLKEQKIMALNLTGLQAQVTALQAALDKFMAGETAKDAADQKTVDAMTAAVQAEVGKVTAATPA